MSPSIFLVIPRRPICLTCSLFVFILIGTLYFNQQFTQLIFSDPSISSDINDGNPSLPNRDYSPRIHQPLTIPILRGLLVFYPHNQEAHFLPELLWFFRSWIEMMKDEAPSWRTDLIIYTGSFTSNLQQLGCVFNQTRLNRHEPPQCRVFLYKRIHLREKTAIVTNDSCPQVNVKRTMLLISHLRQYEYLDSINIISECYPTFAMYDYILRTDLDVFLTRYFGRFVPVQKTILVGGGAYSTQFNNRRLERAAKEMNWSYAKLTNLGSTWYGPPDVAQHIADFSLEAMIHLAIHEFTTPEREGKLGVMLWPEWHFGVLLLYSCHLAFNHLVINESLELGLAHELLDRPSTNSDKYDLELYNRLHIHCWHTSDRFSKFNFKAGSYNNLVPESFLNDTSAVGYTMRLALESRRMSTNGLRQALLQVKQSSRV